MKSFILFPFLLLIGIVNAQSVILLEQDTAAQVHEEVDISGEFESFHVDLLYGNNTNEAISVNWIREIGENCPEEWFIVTADMLLTYLPIINESQFPIVLEPDDPNTFLRQEFYPQSVAGCCDVRMIFFLEGQPDTPIDTGYYHIEINDEGCLTTSISEEAITALHFYPNPTSSVLNIKGEFALESIEIIDLTGRVYDIPFVAYSKQIDLSTLQAGIYMFRARSNSGKLWIGKFLKQ